MTFRLLMLSAMYENERIYGVAQLKRQCVGLPNQNIANREANDLSWKELIHANSEFRQNAIIL